MLAQQNYEQAIADDKALIEEFPNYLNAYLLLTLAASEAGQLEPTRAWLESLLARTPSLPQARVGLAMISESKGDLTSAISNYQEYLRESPDNDRVAVMLASDLAAQRRFAAGESYFKALLDSLADNVAGHHGLATLYAQQDRRAEALRELDQIIAAQPRNALAYSSKAFVLARDARHESAIETLQICLSLLQANPDDVLERSVLNQLGDLYRRSGNYVDAAKTFDRVLTLARATDDLRATETALSQLASVHYRLNNYLEARDYWQRALEVSKTITSRKAKLNTYPQRYLGGIGDVYNRLGDLAQAEELYLEALKISVDVKDDANQSSVLNSLGDLYAEQGKLPQAISTNERALAIGERAGNIPNQLAALNSLSDLSRRNGDASRAMQYVQRALKILAGRSNPVWESESLNNLGRLHLSFNNPAQAQLAFEKALAIDPNTTTPQIAWQTHSGIAAAYERLGDLDKAQDHYRRAIETMESVRARLVGEEEKAGFFQDKIPVYKSLVRLLLNPRLRDLKSQNSVEAFHQVERARARAFLDLLTESKVSLEQQTPPELLKQHKELQQRISQLTAQLIKERSQEAKKQDQAKINEWEKGLGQADAELANWLRELRRRNPRYAALQYPEPISLTAAQQMLDDKTILLSFSLAEPESFLFAVTKNDFQVKRLPPEPVINSGVQKLLVAITDKNNPAPADYRRHALSLSQQLLQPISRMLAGKKSLIVVADGSLHRLPFELLFQPGAPIPADLRQWPYLVRQLAISYAPSASVLAQLQHDSHETAPKSFIAFGDPSYNERAAGVITSTLRATSGGGRLNFQPLPYSHTEIDGIAQLFAKDDRELFFQDAASEENVKVPERLSAYRLVHFSTHGYVNEARPHFSGLVLSIPARVAPNETSPQSEDGLLAAYEIFNLKLKADLVVLSACDTGLGKEIKGEGLMSLTRAFMYAGAPSVVVSLWNVNDESAADLMIRFYRHLQSGETKSEALRQAQLETIRDNGFPFFWAPFVLVGKP